MILTISLVILDFIILGLMIFFFLAFSKEKRDEAKIKAQIEIIKKNYEEKSVEYEKLSKEANEKAQQADAKVQEFEASNKKITEECNSKITTLNESVEARMNELQHLEDTIKQDAQKNIAEFEKQQKEEVEKNMVSLVMNVTNKILSKTLSYDDHKKLIENAINDIKFDE